MPITVLLELKFKPELGRRTLVRALLQARTMEV